MADSKKRTASLASPAAAAAAASASDGAVNSSAKRLRPNPAAGFDDRISQWSVKEVGGWIRSLDPNNSKFDGYVATFAANGVDGSILLHDVNDQHLTKWISSDRDRMCIGFSLKALRSSTQIGGGDGGGGDLKWISEATQAAVPITINAIGTGAISVTGPLTNSRHKRWIKHHETLMAALVGAAPRQQNMFGMRAEIDGSFV